MLVHVVTRSNMWRPCSYLLVTVLIHVCPLLIYAATMHTCGTRDHACGDPCCACCCLLVSVVPLCNNVVIMLIHVLTLLVRVVTCADECGDS